MLGANFKKSVSRITNWGHERPRRESKQGCSWLLSSCLERISSLMWGLNQRRAQSWGEGERKVGLSTCTFGQVAWMSAGGGGGGTGRCGTSPGLQPLGPPFPAPAADTARLARGCARGGGRRVGTGTPLEPLRGCRGNPPRCGLARGICPLPRHTSVQAASEMGNYIEHNLPLYRSASSRFC